MMMRILQFYRILIFALFAAISNGSENKQYVSPLPLGSGDGQVAYVVTPVGVPYIIIADYGDKKSPHLVVGFNESNMVVTTGFVGQKRRSLVDPNQPILEILSSDGTWRSIHIKKLSEKQLQE